MNATAYGSPGRTKSATANAALAGLNRPATVKELSEASGLPEDFIRKHFLYHARHGFPDGSLPVRGKNAAGDEILRCRYPGNCNSCLPNCETYLRNSSRCCSR